MSGGLLVPPPVQPTVASHRPLSRAWRHCMRLPAACMHSCGERGRCIVLSAAPFCTTMASTMAPPRPCSCSAPCSCSCLSVVLICWGHVRLSPSWVPSTCRVPTSALAQTPPASVQSSASAAPSSECMPCREGARVASHARGHESRPRASHPAASPRRDLALTRASTRSEPLDRPLASAGASRRDSGGIQARAGWWCCAISTCGLAMCHVAPPPP